MYGKEFVFFLQVYKDGSIRKAAKSLYISPQGLGKALTTLEQDLGVRLFERSKDGIHLTEQGKDIHPFIENIVDNVYAIHSSIQKQNNRISGTLDVACSFGAVGELNHSLFTDFKILFPDVTLNVTEGSDHKIQGMVASSDNLIGISVGPSNRTDLKEYFLTSHNLVWLINKKNPLAAKERIEFADLKNESLVMYSDEFVVYHNVLACCKKAGFTPNYAYFINEAIMAYKFCKEYNAVALTVDFIAKDVAVNDIVIKPILDPDCQWNLYLIHKAGGNLDEVQWAFICYLLKATASQRSQQEDPPHGVKPQASKATSLHQLV